MLMFNFFSCVGQQPDIPAKYEEVAYFSEGLAAVKKDNRWGFIDTLGKIKIGFQFTQTESFAQGICKVKVRGSQTEDWYGIIRKDGTFLLPLEYEEIYIHEQAIAFSSHGKYGFMNRQTGEMIHLSSGKLISFQNDLGLCLVNGKYGFVDWKGCTIVEPTYDFIASTWKEDFYIATINLKKGLLDKNGKELIPCIYQELEVIHNRTGQNSVLVATLANNKKCLLNWEGSRLSLEVEAISANSGDPAKLVFQQNNLMGIMNYSGEILVPAQHQSIHTAYGYHIVKQGNYWGLTDPRNKIIIPATQEYINAISPNRFIVTHSTQSTLVSNTNEILATFPYIDISLDDDLIRIQNEGKFGFMDNSGKIIIPCLYDMAERFGKGLAKVKLNNKTSFITPKGQLLFEFRYEDLTLSEDRFIVHHQNKYGLLDSQGSLLVKPQYDFISTFTAGVASVKKGKKYGCIYKDGRILQKAEVSGVHELLAFQCPTVQEGWVGMKIENQWGFMKLQ
jgi:hypothetical protein